MNSTELDVKRIYELAQLVHRKLGLVSYCDPDCFLKDYWDDQIHIPDYWWADRAFRVYQTLDWPLVEDLLLEAHAVSRHIDNKDELLQDILHHGSRDAVKRRAYEVYGRRTKAAARVFEPYVDSPLGRPLPAPALNLRNDLDDWFQAEREILNELHNQYRSDWELQTLYDSNGSPTMCVILKRGPWIEHLVNLAPTCS